MQLRRGSPVAAGVLEPANASEPIPPRIERPPMRNTSRRFQLVGIAAGMVRVMASRAMWAG